MKTDIHPQYYPEATVTCACGAVHTIGSTVEKMQVEICAACHPFYTGQDKIMDTAGRVEKFKSRSAAARAPKVKEPRVKKQAGADTTKTASVKKKAAAKKKGK